jgi:deazaflavin-dependent oxidoreductase (nitroreductase family)
MIRFHSPVLGWRKMTRGMILPRERVTWVSMPLPRWLARFNRHVTNHILGPLARYAPWMAIVVHIGRNSHRRYRTPVVIFPRDVHFLIALTYGPESEWVQNVLTAGGCALETMGRTLRLSEPRIVHDRHMMPLFVRGFLWLLNVSDFLELRC